MKSVIKILCTKEEYTKIVQNCVFAVRESDCQVCIFKEACCWDFDYLPSLCEIVPEEGAIE